VGAEVAAGAKRAGRQHPQDTQVCAHFFAGRYAEACSLAELAMRENANAAPPPCIAAASSALARRLEDAHRRWRACVSSFLTYAYQT